MKIIKEILEILLEIIFPSTSIEQKVRKMNFHDFNQLKFINLETKSRVLSFFKYKNPFIREAIWQIKYRRNERLIKIFAEIIYAGLLEEISDMELFQNFSNPVLIPVPMSKKEKRKRGYNQAELLASEIAKIGDNSLDFDSKLLQKIKNTKRQTKLKKAERLQNIKGAFKLLRSDLNSLNVVLIDDVYTTGATVGEAKNILEKAGARVFVVVIAK